MWSIPPEPKYRSVPPRTGLALSIPDSRQPSIRPLTLPSLFKVLLASPHPTEGVLVSQLLESGHPVTAAQLPPLRTASWEDIRKLFALDPATIHLNTGTVGAMPYEVLDTVDRVTREWTGGLADGVEHLVGH